MNKKTFLVIALIVALTTVASASGTPEAEDSFPSETVTIIVPFGVGGNLDLKARLIAQYLEEDLGVPVVVDNRPGAGGVVGSTEFLASEASGHRMILLNEGALILAGLMNQANFAPSDFAPIIGMDTVHNVLVANPAETGIRDVESLISYGDENGIVFSSQGPATVQYMAQKTMYNEMGINSENLMSTSQQEALSQVLGGHADLSVVNEARAASYVEAGQLVAVVSFGDTTLPNYAGGPDVPSVVDYGYDVSFASFNFLAYKAGVAESERELMYNAIANVYEEPTFQDEFRKLALRISPIHGDEVVARVEASQSTIVEMMDNLK